MNEPIDSGAASSTNSSSRGNARSIVRNTFAFGTVALLLLGAFGQILRDRWVISGLMMNIPLLPIGILGLFMDLICRGRTLRFIPFGVSVLALPCIAWSAYTLQTMPISHATHGEPLRILQWNVQWGGGGNRSEAAWSQQCDLIAAHRPDIVVVNEGPVSEWLPSLDQKLSAPTSLVYFEHPSNQSYWYRIVVASRWPVRLEGTYPLTNGAALSAVVELPGREIRVLAVDGISTPTVSRLPLLLDVEQLIRGATMLGRPFDVIAGDFNTTSRSIGFDPLRDARFQLASEHFPGWRATFPSYLPLYDIDHIWVSPLQRVTGGGMFSHRLTTNHRGQYVDLAPPRPIAPSARSY